VADTIEPGDHAATFGAHPVSCAVAVEVFGKLSDPAFLADVKKKGEHLRTGLEALMEQHSEKISEIRGEGLIAGAVMKDTAAGDLVATFREKGILVCVAGPDVVRFLPPLTVEKAHIDELLAAFGDILEKL
jgi:acetylornithine/succinyldiaminopimelate/putrescine aminotransferase